MAGRAPFLREDFALRPRSFGARAGDPARAARRHRRRAHVGDADRRRPGAVHGAAGAGDRRKRCLEIGTYTGYSALAVALALPEDGHITCCDINKEWTAIAQKFWAKAGVERKIDLRIGPALETLRTLKGPFDFVFIDADKPNYANYYDACLPMVRRGGIIAIDNTLWSGWVADPEQKDADTALRAFNDKLHRDERVALSLLPLGDGVTLALKK